MRPLCLVDSERESASSIGVRRACLAMLPVLVTLATRPARAQGLWPQQMETVQRIQATVVAGSAALAAVRADLEAAGSRTAGAGFAPPVVLSGEMEDVPDGYDVTAASFRLEVGRELPTGGRSAAARALAAASAELPRVRLEALERQLRADVLLILARLVAADGIARRLAAEDTLLLAAESSTRDRFSVGEARYMDVLRLRTERLRVQTERATALAEGQAALEALVGLAEPGRRAEITTLTGAFLAAAGAGQLAVLPPAPAVDSLLAMAAPVLLADAALERARAARAVVSAEQRVRFAASLGAQRRVEPGGRSTIGPVVGGSITLPFTAGRANRAKRIAAERDVESAEATVENLRARVTAALAGAVARYEAARERASVYDLALLATAREERESALAAYRTGDISLVELLDFERSLSRAEIERLRAQTSAIETYANLIAPAGLNAGEELGVGGP